MKKLDVCFKITMLYLVFFACGVLTGMSIPCGPCSFEKQGVVFWDKFTTEISADVRTVMDLPHTPPTPILTVEDKGFTDEEVFKAICTWEGPGHKQIDINGFNKKEKAYGASQVRQLYLDDANEELGTNYALWDCYTYEVCFKLWKGYCKRYKFTTIEDRVRGHNGGPRGPQKKSTDVYWEGVRDILNSWR